MKQLMLLMVLVIGLNAQSDVDIKKIKSDCLDKKDAQACSEASNYYLKQGNTNEGVLFLAQSCSYGGAGSCMVLGKTALDQGDFKSATTFFKLGCEKGSETSCEIYNNLKDITSS